MAEKSEDQKLKNNIKKVAGKIDYKALYEQISEENPILKANKPFWVTKGNSQKYFCSLCNIGIPVSTNLHVFKSAVLAHLQDKYHKKRYDTFIANEGAANCPMNEPVVNRKCKDKSPQTIEDELSILDITQKEEEVLARGTEKHKEEKNNTNNNWRDKIVPLVDLDKVYDSFEKSNPVVKTSKQFIVKTENGRDFFCTLCKVLIFNSLSAIEFRYNLFVHLNEETHREKLPNFSKITKDFDKVMVNFASVLPASYKNEIKCFEVGPVFRYVKCSLCDVAVSSNLHRLENHLQSESHTEKRQRALKGEPLQIESLNQRTRNAFRKLVVQLDHQYKKDIKYIHIGKIPGYVLCSLCSYVALPTKFYVETHLSSAVHANNKSTNLINRNSRFKIALEDLLKTLPEDLQDYNIFDETACGLTCKRCDTTIPPTSYDLYTHINKERLACVSM